jgi:hypothetical protein
MNRYDNHFYEDIPQTWYQADVFLSRAIHHIAATEGWGSSAIGKINTCRDVVFNDHVSSSKEEL